MRNPYTPPEAELDADTHSPRRPVLVWIISVIYGLSTLSSLITTPLLFSGVLAVPEPQKSQLAQIGPGQLVLIVLSGILMLAFVVQLFRLRASAVTFCAVILATSVFTAAYQLIQRGIPSGTYETIGVFSTAFGLGLLIAVYFYTRRLRANNVLR